MEDKPKGEPVAGVGGSQAARVPPPPPVVKEGDANGVQHVEGHQQPAPQLKPVKRSRIKRLSRFFSRSEWVNVFLTAVIAGTGVIGIVLVIQSGKDTKKIITAAQQQATAAQQFANTASLINGGIEGAVGKLDNQAKATQMSANAAQEQSSTSARELELSQRPWVAAKFTPVDKVLVDEEGMHLTVEMNAKDIGQSPAVRVAYGFALMSFPRDFYAARKELCKSQELGSKLKANGKFLETWFPGDANTVRVTITLPRKDFFAPEKDRPPQFVTAPTVIACVAYRPSFKDVEYHTGYILILRHFSNGKETTISSAHWEAPATEFYLVEQFATGADAN